jgi:hypothetical protein
MLDTLENDVLMISYKLPILDVAECAPTSFPFMYMLNVTHLLACAWVRLSVESREDEKHYSDYSSDTKNNRKTRLYIYV